MAVRPIDANALARRIRDYMDDFPNAATRLATCRVILSMLGDENQTPTLTQPNEPLAWSDLEGIHYEPVYIVGIGNDAHYWSIVECAFRDQVWLQIAGGFSTIVSRKEYGKTWIAYRRPPEGEEEKS